MRSRAIEMFLALGLAATVSACNGGTTTTPGGEAGEVGTPQPTQTQPTPGGEAGEAGEAGEGGEN
ncbi:hypothetical protein [Chroococcidiopsis sp. TS-821]|uniref:hypothetical protein n=1 Tax=Chroococcidiopsis sp. TS-821 TaxID=1378066 RepID=UPI000CEF59F4|nr:hypothetical protein [Chroococcidiopsis sp. TS-821]PPS42824.1 hypothetical protein B1A85_14035 [Chroococcidiopsis sp. TS-821]